jgi:hypothetical protein
MFGAYNHPPIATVLSPMYILVGIEQTIIISTIDANNEK